MTDEVCIPIAKYRGVVSALRDARHALDVLSTEAGNFSVSGVYFSEACMGHKGLKLADEAIAKIDALNICPPQATPK